MTAKDKAKELVHRFLQIYDGRVPQAKQCALICVDEIYKLNNLDVGRYEGEQNIEMYYSYWEEVKQEIEKL